MPGFEEWWYKQHDDFYEDMLTLGDVEDAWKAAQKECAKHILKEFDKMVADVGVREGHIDWYNKMYEEFIEDER